MRTLRIEARSWSCLGEGVGEVGRQEFVFLGEGRCEGLEGMGCLFFTAANAEGRFLDSPVICCCFELFLVVELRTRRRALISGVWGF